ncbi:hypothetical protein QYM36_004403 [Artemia franciscana]|uniref:Uncharacterized protein n=1 Tax=Artemia franciscana TaxID=6661 RepID=A0AA88LCM4_ARTSF|nr:hypothetical protein QYM36_004403 [Artemia franciscana]
MYTAENIHQLISGKIRSGKSKIKTPNPHPVVIQQEPLANQQIAFNPSAEETQSGNIINNHKVKKYTT